MPTTVARALRLRDEALAHELPQNARKALLGDAQDGEEVGDGGVRIAPDEIDDAVMSAAETVLGQHRVGLGGEIAIGIEQELHALPEVFLAQEEGIGARLYVSHVDIFTGDCYVCPLLQ